MDGFNSDSSTDMEICVILVTLMHLKVSLRLYA